MKTLYVEKINKLNFDNIFIIEKDGEDWSYNAFFDNAINIGYTISQTGKNKIVTILPNSIKLCILYFSALLFDMVIVPIDIEKSNEEIEHIVKQNMDGVVIYSNVTEVDNIPNECQKLEVVKLELYNHRRNVKDIVINKLKQLDGDKLFLITYTSGTEAEPKGVMHSIHNLIASSESFSNRFGFDEKCIWGHVMPMAYMAGILNSIIMPFMSGGKIVLLKRFSMPYCFQMWKDILEYRINTIWLAPTMVNLAGRLGKTPEILKYVKQSSMTILVGTAPLTEKVKKQFETDFDIQLYPSYGLSETLFVSTVDKNNYSLNENVTAGTLLKEVEYKLQPDGELLIYVPWMFLGYTNVEDQCYFENKYYKTGDLVTINSDNIISIVGRSKEVIIRGGINVSPAQLENIIASELGIDVVIFGIKEDNEELIGCAYVAEHRINETEKIIGNVILKRIGVGIKVDRFCIVKEIPLNINGKVDRKKMKDIYHQQQAKR